MTHADRIIPAPAGNARRPLSCPIVPADHPRACGERFVPVKKYVGVVGSSPRLRGTRSTRARTRPRARIIPAPAGNALCQSKKIVWMADHPRACGERSAAPSRPVQTAGSSPRLRGTHRHRLGGRRRSRIIPAPAGNAAGKTIQNYLKADHPRACGERTKADFRTRTSRGSSPRLRGTRPQGLRCSAGGRIIPAPAGNASHSLPGRAPCPDHPRACGERTSSRRSRPCFNGSSPRLRGTLDKSPAHYRAYRIIPAPAGNAGPDATLPGGYPDHPRACGERSSSSLATSPKVGSSPRLRGTLVRQHADFTRTFQGRKSYQKTHSKLSMILYY